MEDYEHRARLILADAHAKANPHSLDAKRVAAAEKLVDTFLDLAKSQGLKVGRTTDGNDNRFVATSSKACLVMVDGDGSIYLMHQSIMAGPNQKLVTAALTYDPVLDEYVGTQEDTEVMPEPGGKKQPRLHPLVVLAKEAAVQLEGPQRS